MKTRFCFLTCLVAVFVAASPAQCGSVAQTHALGNRASTPEEQEALAQPLRDAAAQQYDFVGCRLGDLLRLLGKDAEMSFISISDDRPEANHLITLSMKGSPFQVLEIVCKANDLTLIHEGDLWYIRAMDDTELTGRSYSILNEKVKREVMLADVKAILAPPPDIGEEQGKSAPLRKAIWKPESKILYVIGTRLQHQWVASYLAGAGLLPK